MRGPSLTTSRITVELDITDESLTFHTAFGEQFVATKVEVDQLVWREDGRISTYVAYFAGRGRDGNCTYRLGDVPAPECVARHLAQATAARFSGQAVEESVFDVAFVESGRVDR